MLLPVAFALRSVTQLLWDLDDSVGLTAVAEIRQKIYRHLFHRPVGLVPGEIRYDHGGTFIKLYSYEWDIDDRHVDDDYCSPGRSYLPSYNETTRRWVDKTWKTKSTKEEQALLESGALNRKYEDFFPDTFTLPTTNPYAAMNEDSGGVVSATRMYTRDISKRGDFEPQVVNNIDVRITGLCGISLLRTNKQIMEEATCVLYGENEFVFDTRGKKRYHLLRDGDGGIHAYDAFSKDRHLIPELPLPDGRPPSPEQVDTAIDEMFSRDATQPIFNAKDPMTKFFNEIGPDNTSKIRSVQIKGFFKTADEDEEFKYNRPIGMAQTLPIYTTILNHVCKGLQRFSIFYDKCGALWDDDVEEELDLADEERLDEIVGKVVDALPSLQKLNLDHQYYWFRWGKAARWEVVVEESYKEYDKERAAKKDQKRIDSIGKPNELRGIGGHGTSNHRPRRAPLAYRGTRNPFAILANEEVGSFDRRRHHRSCAIVREK